MRIKSCPWVLRRLPLLDGGELAVDERRRVERHLIGCPDCRGRRSASAEALSALRIFASEAPARPVAPPLWPALARQIRQSRHAAPRPAWSWSWLMARASPALSFGLALGGVMAVGFALGRTAPAPIVSRAPGPRTLVAANPPAGPSGSAYRAAKVPANPRGALPETPRSPSLVTRDNDPFRPPTTRVDYDLDHGYPIGYGPRDPQRSY